MCVVMVKNLSVKGGSKTYINLGVNNDVHDLMKKLTIKEIEVEGNKVAIKRGLTDVYNWALEYAIQHLDEWSR